MVSMPRAVFPLVLLLCLPAPALPRPPVPVDPVVRPGPAASARPLVPAGSVVFAGSVVPAGPMTGHRAAAQVGYRWPLPGVPRVRRGFEPPPQPWSPGHRGVDLAGTPGTPVGAAGPGVVLFAGPVAGRPVLTVGHAEGLRTTYEPVAAVVRVGDQVTPGQALGSLLPGHPGCPDPACLHWGLRRDQEYLDPLSLLGLGPVRLLPVSGSP
jgi:murein DD-endopeptidase MepM/ murein hydrolase activator NlpD